MAKFVQTVFFVLLLGVIVAGSPVLAAKRIALVIGNSNYATAPLANPANDARLMTKSLRGLGFEVIERLDANQKAMLCVSSNHSRWSYWPGSLVR